MLLFPSPPAFPPHAIAPRWAKVTFFEALRLRFFRPFSSFFPSSSSFFSCCPFSLLVLVIFFPSFFLSPILRWKINWRTSSLPVCIKVTLHPNVPCVCCWQAPLVLPVENVILQKLLKLLDFGEPLLYRCRLVYGLHVHFHVIPLFKSVHPSWGHGLVWSLQQRGHFFP